MAFILKRTFKALEAKSQEERIKFNHSIITSDYLPSHKYAVIDFQNKLEMPFKTKEEAKEFISN